ncbi:MAG: hypothetical protein B6245_09295 [Desulfobacteraceae bacterium 4572_88]|nr:MAG: hypothetical protein B6245_09295 [Desulfobacteraceae bacterium 4572_88]RLC11025.1 MAG: hypothetical protein DRI57_19510 [Deltaproteobacteria bacterium]
MLRPSESEKEDKPCKERNNNMKDYQKTKAQLIEELEATRRQLTKLESELAKKEGLSENQDKTVASRPIRKEIHAAIEFIADFDIIEAKGINLSEGGICFELDEDLPFEMQFTLDGTRHRHRAHLIWVKRLPNGGYRFGLEFVQPEPYPII